MAALSQRRAGATRAVPLEWGVASSVRAGEAESGDRHVVRSHPQGVLLAAVDGLGHGGEAAAAARLAVRVLRRHAAGSPVSLVQLCHEALKDTRGVVMSIASFDARRGTMTWLGVGNVEGILLKADANVPQGLLLRAGVVGYTLPPLQEATVPLSPGDTLVLATDGIRAGFTDQYSRGVSAQQLADRILAHHGKSTDDALVLVARFLGLRH